MGALTSRQNAGVEEVDVASNHAYKYPPKSGHHFIMGGERFDTPQPEAYLFGENADLNFLGSRPTPFPYPPPQANEPTKTLKSLVNIRKESLRLVKAVPAVGKLDGDKQSIFNIEFTFDSDARTSITIYYFSTEEVTPNGVIYTPRDSTITSETFHYKRGANQQFIQPSHIFDPSRFTDEELLYNPDKEIVPIAIHCVAQEGPDETRQSHTCIAVVERHTDGSYVIKALKQKIFVDGLCYLLQEIYGIENKNIENPKSGSEVDTEDNGSECVICMCDVRDTLILPCRHLCLCNSCADSLRYQANNCPICRAPFRALLQIRALQKSTSTSQLPSLPPEGSCENIPAGYEGVSLIEALNGPCIRATQPIRLDSVDTPDHDIPSQLLNRSSLERTPKSSKMVSSPDYEGECVCPTAEVRMSVLLAREAESIKDKSKSPHMSSKRREKSVKHKDTVRTVNPLEEDLDSEAEKLSPLLDKRQETQNDREAAPPSPPIPTSPGRGSSLDAHPLEDDSDYYTPEDPATTILSPLHCEKVTSPTTATSIG
ncbi:hypothetical protein AAG570_010291 [Ranatra chinensis]|uniref:RING-type E3 ubiquitin transferase n=1 Tax=Ranatra chinensis TaxID=642074 RepID=A0ABD0YM36_9HEMI